MKEEQTINQNTTEPNRTAEAGQLDCRVRPVAVGYVSYDVRVNCPNCNKDIYLNQYPYDDEETEFSLTDDELGLALFGTKTKPATWDNFEIEYKCCKCRKPFLLTGIEI